MEPPLEKWLTVTISRLIIETKKPQPIDLKLIMAFFKAVGGGIEPPRGS
jgi:hypothetical protein